MKSMMSMKTNAQKWGNSLAVRIPHKIAKKIALFDGAEVEIGEKDNMIMVKPTMTDVTLQGMVSQISDENRHTKINLRKRNDVS